MPIQEDPARLLREAWSTVPLTAIRAFVEQTIARLGTIKQDDLLGRAVSRTLAATALDPVRQALRACTEELRTESGMHNAKSSDPESEQAAEQRAASVSGWTALYQEALAKYREVATRALRNWLDSVKAPASPRPPGK
jgi:hypothetical protein